MTDRTVLITGCSSGIGRATAHAFLDEEWTVYATARDTDDVEDLADAGAVTESLDVTKPARCRTVVDDLVDEEGRLDCLVNNAGYGQFGTVEDVPTRKLNRQFDVNVYGPHRLIRAALPHMREQEEGTIVNLSSVAGRVSFPGMGTYSASKFALEAMSDALRNEVDQHGIDVALVEPGPVETKFSKRVREEQEEIDETSAYANVYELFRDYHSTGDAGASRPEDVAEVVLEAAVSPNPDPRYPVGTVGKAGVLARFVPDRIRDKIVSLALRLV
ncbi:SDR family oxidoreductase [Halospeciosus flavus]|uniref:SDR family oxidoreductase n=1 Tax=Halospeciosus flavus TaxID=3032283 RepID=A0ABD5Z5Q4_9EURY|nr:SDR family oxidoreductase [Halospeciosus flavus]